MPGRCSPPERSVRFIQARVGAEDVRVAFLRAAFWNRRDEYEATSLLADLGGPQPHDAHELLQHLADNPADPLALELLALADGTYARLLVRLARVDVLILDDWGMAPLGPAERRDMSELMEASAGQSSSPASSRSTSPAAKNVAAACASSRSSPTRRHRPRLARRCWRAGVNGAEKELTALAKRFGGHALTTSLLGTALARFCDGDLS